MHSTMNLFRVAPVNLHTHTNKPCSVDARLNNTKLFLIFRWITGNGACWEYRPPAIPQSIHAVLTTNTFESPIQFTWSGVHFTTFSICWYRVAWLDSSRFWVLLYRQNRAKSYHLAPLYFSLSLFFWTWSAKQCQPIQRPFHCWVCVTYDHDGIHCSLTYYVSPSSRYLFQLRHVHNCFVCCFDHRS